jgi:(R,R)-butanediol dehydrogenase/meso-butanediol dehydrogenase/diacetyl reductase
LRAVRLHGIGDLRVETLAPPPPPGPGEVRLRVEAAGICGSDLHNYRTGQWLGPRVSVPGHELSGRVTAVGEGVDGFRPGDLVAADSRVWCGACPACRAGRRHLCATLGFVGEVCDGGFAEEVVLPARLLQALPPDLDPVVAAFLEPLAVALHAVRRLRVPAWEPVLVAGCGPIGGLAALLLSRRHDGPILLAERNAARLRQVAEVSGGAAIDLDAAFAAPVRYAVEATGQVGVLSTLLERLAGGGRIALVGIFHERIDLDPNRLVEAEIALVGCHAFADELPEAACLLPGLAPDLRRFVEAEIAVEDLPAAYARLARGEAANLKTIVRPNGTGA